MKGFLEVLLNIHFLTVKGSELKPKEERTLISRLILNGIKYVVRHTAYAYLQIKRITGLVKIIPLIDSPEKVIVSLTTFPLRINNLWMVLYCIYQQTILPGKIIVVLTKEEIPQGLESLPKSLKFFLDKGVEILFTEDNLRPHNKYFYTRQKYQDRTVITIDDDGLYYKNTIERLLNLHKKYPNAICANKTTKIVLDGERLGNYSKYKLAINHDPSHFLLALGVCGVLYPASFKYPELYNIEKIKKLALNTDDLWLKAMEILANIKVTTGDYCAHPMVIPSSQKKALMHTNNGPLSQNDKNLMLLDSEYNISHILQNLI
ncbi:MAG: hypothetical protein IKW86_05050 [Salinivirgaceae bacterium]|nr:hypothetical protein [Salinivirgaceae bacterium]